MIRSKRRNKDRPGQKSVGVSAALPHCAAIERAEGRGTFFFPSFSLTEQTEMYVFLKKKKKEDAFWLVGGRSGDSMRA